MKRACCYWNCFQLFLNDEFSKKLKSTFMMKRRGKSFTFFYTLSTELCILTLIKNISIPLALILLRKYTLDMCFKLFIFKVILYPYVDIVENIMLTMEIFQWLREVDRFYGHITLSDIPVCSIYFLYYLGWKSSCPNYLQHQSWTCYLITSSLETPGKSE